MIKTTDKRVILFLSFFFLRVNKVVVVVLGCEDIILEELSPSTLLCTLEWSSCAHGSDWVYRQAMQFLQDEFVNIAQSEVFPFLPKKYLVETLKSDFLQVRYAQSLLKVVVTPLVTKEYFSVYK